MTARQTTAEDLGDDPSIFKALFFIEGNDPDVYVLDVGEKIIRESVANIERLGNAVGRNQEVNQLSIEWDDDAPAEKVEAFCRGLQQNRSIEAVNFMPCGLLVGNVLQSLTCFFEHNPNLKVFRIFHEDQLSDAENEALRTVLLAARNSLEEIQFSTATPPDEAGPMDGFFSSLRLLPHLETLSFTGDMDERGCANVVRLLQDPQLTLRHLSFNTNAINYDQSSLFDALNGNSTLRSLSFVGSERNSFFGRMLNSLRFHNHTLESVSADVFHIDRPNPKKPDEVESLLELNRHENKEFVRIRKELDYGFLIPGRPYDRGVFEGFVRNRDLPNLLSSFFQIRNRRDCREESFRLSALYHFIRNEPILVVSSVLNR